jgi:hypothetical protein
MKNLLPNFILPKNMPKPIKVATDTWACKPLLEAGFT